MNTEEYIESGILEAYVLGELTQDEVRQVELNLRHYPELRDELSRIEETHEAIMMMRAVEPPPQVKHRVMDEIKKKERAGMENRRWLFDSAFVPRWAIAASVALVLLVGVAALSYRNLWVDSERTLVALESERALISEHFSQASQKLEKVENDLQITQDIAFQKVMMTGTSNLPELHANVFWNTTTAEVYLATGKMKPLPSEMQYQLWAIVDGKPVDAGLFDLTTPGLIKMKNISGNVSAFAVTLEPAGGSTAPTLSAMQVVGEV